MSSNKLIRDLENATFELLAAAGDADLSRVQKLLECRGAVLNRIATSDPSSFTPHELFQLRTAAHNGEAALERLALLRRAAAGDWHRVHQLRSSNDAPANNNISLSA